MQICYESNLQCKFTTLLNDYKIAICLVYIFNVFQTIRIRLSVSVSQIIQIFKCKVNIKCYIFNNMQPLLHLRNTRKKCSLKYFALKCNFSISLVWKLVCFNTCFLNAVCRGKNLQTTGIHL